MQKRIIKLGFIFTLLFFINSFELKAVNFDLSLIVLNQNNDIEQSQNVNQNNFDVFAKNSDIDKNKKPESKHKGITFFHGTWNEALALAKRENKLIFLDAYASWCGPCRMMKSRVFSKSKSGDFFNENFINVAIDMEKGEGRGLSRKYRIRAYPTLLFIDHTGKVKETSVGYHSTKQLLSLGRQVLK